MCHRDLFSRQAFELKEASQGLEECAFVSIVSLMCALYTMGNFDTIKAESFPEKEAIHLERSSDDDLPRQTRYYEPKTAEERTLDRIVNLKLDFAVVLVLAINFIVRSRRV